MIYLVEGLNCSGKTTWIKEQPCVDIDNVINTPFANPLRFTGLKKFLSDIFDFNPYYYGAYETILELNTQIGQNDVWFWDRTWISAWVYGSITNKRIFDELVRIYTDHCKVIFIDTPVDECLKRWKERDNAGKEYVDLQKDWRLLREKFVETVNILEARGMNVQRIESSKE